VGNVYAKFRRTPLRIKKALGIFRELITTTRQTTRVAFGTHLPGPKRAKKCTADICETAETDSLELCVILLLIILHSFAVEQHEEELHCFPRHVH